MSFLIEVEDTCIGCGSCEAICPETFVMKGDKAKAKRSSVEKITCEKEAEDACPSESISVKKG